MKSELTPEERAFGRAIGALVAAELARGCEASRTGVIVQNVLDRVCAYAPQLRSMGKTGTALVPFLKDYLL